MKSILYTILLVLTLFACKSESGAKTESTDPFAEAKALYASNCSSCHGVKMEMFVDRNWKHGNSADSIATSIKNGYINQGMPSFDTLFTEEQLDKLVAYIQHGIDNRESYSFEETFNPDTIFNTDGVTFTLELVTDELEIPWSFAFLPDNSMLIAEEKGTLYYRDLQGNLSTVSEFPGFVRRGQGGLLDVEIDPNFEENKTVYISYSKGDEDESTTVVVKGEFENGQLQNMTEIFEALPYLPTNHHYGGRIEFDNEGMLFITVGDRGRRDDNPQSLSNHAGKVHRINPDGSIPADNPFVNQDTAVASIWSYGHRNPQGLYFEKSTSTMWEHEHGPRGGDELNIIKKGENYGWPVVSFGINYNGTTFTNKTEMPGMTNSEKYWVPSIAPCGLSQVTSDLYPGWEGDLLVGSLRFQYLNKVSKDMSEVSLLKNIGRMRTVRVDQEGYIYVSTEEPGAIYKLVPQESL